MAFRVQTDGRGRHCECWNLTALESLRGVIATEPAGSERPQLSLEFVEVQLLAVRSVVPIIVIPSAELVAQAACIGLISRLIVLAVKFTPLVLLN